MTPETRGWIEQFVQVPCTPGSTASRPSIASDGSARHLAVLRGRLSRGRQPPGIAPPFPRRVDRLGSLSPGGRLDLFLRGLDLPETLTRRLRAGLGRFREDPRGPEEELLHDALLLESAGVAAAAERLMAMGKKRTPLTRALTQLDPGSPAERYRTARGASLGSARRQEAETWIAELRGKVAAEEAFS